jgi:hypothetical protein
VSVLAGPGIAMVGTRTFTDRAAVRDAIKRIKRQYPHAVIHTGDAKGADTLVIEEASAAGVPCISHQAQWRKPDGSLDRSAGHKRNPDIVNPCQMLLAFYGPGSSNGTDGSVRVAHRNGIRVYEYRNGRWTFSERLA